jgi:hypothetical protein
MGMGMGMNAGVPMADNIFEAGFQGAEQTQLVDNMANAEPIANADNNLNNKLTGGSKNFFLKKKK